MALIDRTPSTETAAHLETRLQDMGNEVVVGYSTSTSVAYSANSLILRQRVTVTEYEYSGLTYEAASLLCTLASNNVSTTRYYKAIASSSDYVAVGIQTGTDKAYKISQVVGKMYTVRRTDTTYAAADAVGWSASVPSVTSNGVEVSRSMTSNYIYAYVQSGTSYALLQNEETVVTRYQFRTLAQAQTLVANNTSNTINYQTFTIRLSATVSRVLPVGVIKSASARYVDGDNQYTVEVVTRTLSKGGASQWS